MVAHRLKNKITSIKNKEGAQISSDAAFVKSAKRTDANAGMQVRTPKNIWKLPNGGVNRTLLCGR